MNTLALNAGSTSLKFGVFGEATREPLLWGELDWAGGQRDKARLVWREPRKEEVCRTVAVPTGAAAAQCALRCVEEHFSGPIAAVGHRVVHGGTALREAVRAGAEVKAAIARLNRLAPLHNPAALEALEAAEAAWPPVPQVAVFDTAFYARLPAREYLYPVPLEWHNRWGIRRFGFHGLSHAYCALRAAELTGLAPGRMRLINCHLGGGCSATAIQGGLAVATTMGFSPLEGLMMATRPGSIDSGILLHLLREKLLSVDELDAALNSHSGLLGVSGLSADFAEIEKAAGEGHERARLAFDMFAGRVCSAIGGLAASLGGLDVLTFTDRVGERSPGLRAAVCGNLEFLGVRLAPGQNSVTRGDAEIGAPGSGARVFVLRTREEWMVARETARLLAGGV